ncbi:MAG TPA: hypothetical protein VFK70_05345 [Vicinamibacteria bacterium]|nr:hypothetical protein [Vicinamibacteria bacterium]
MTALWIAFAGCAIFVVALCTPPVVRLLARSSPTREPPAQPDGLRLGTITLPCGDLDIPPGAVATGRLVRVKTLAPGESVFTLRHTWISADLGLPAVGLAIDGAVRVTSGEATVSVFAPFGGIAPIALIWALLFVGSASSLVAAPSFGGAALVLLMLAGAFSAWRRARRAVALVAADAVESMRHAR